MTLLRFVTFSIYFMVFATNEERPQKRKIKKISRYRSRSDDSPEPLGDSNKETQSGNEPGGRNDTNHNVDRNQWESSTINTTDAPSTEASNDDSTSSSFDSNGQSNAEQDGPPAQKARIGEVPEEHANDYDDFPTVGTIQDHFSGDQECSIALQSLLDWNEQFRSYEDTNAPSNDCFPEEERQCGPPFTTIEGQYVQQEWSEEWSITDHQEVTRVLQTVAQRCDPYDQEPSSSQPDLTDIVRGPSIKEDYGITNHQNAPGYTDDPPNDCFPEEERQCGPPFTAIEGQYVQQEWSEEWSITDHQEVTRVLQTVAQRCDPYDQEPSSSQPDLTDIVLGPSIKEDYGITNHQNAPGYTDAPPNCFNEQERQCGPPFTTIEGQYVQQEWSEEWSITDHQEVTRVLQTVAQRCDPYDQEPSSSGQPDPTGSLSAAGSETAETQPQSNSVPFVMSPRYNPCDFSTEQNDRDCYHQLERDSYQQQIHSSASLPNLQFANLDNGYLSNPGYQNGVISSDQQQCHPNDGQSMSQQPGRSQRDYYPVTEEPVEKIVGKCRACLTLFKNNLNARNDISASIFLQWVDECVGEVDTFMKKSPLEKTSQPKANQKKSSKEEDSINYLPGIPKLEDFLLDSELLPKYRKEMRDMFTFFGKTHRRIDGAVNEADIEEAWKRLQEELPSTSTTKQKGAGRPAEDQALRKKIVGIGRACLILFENNMNARNYTNASTWLKRVDDCLEKLDDLTGNKKKSPPEETSQPGANQTQRSQINYQPKNLELLRDFQLLPEYLKKRQDAFNKFEIRINDAKRKENVEKWKREALEKLKQKCAAALANFFSDYEGKKDVIISCIRSFPVVKEFNDKAVLFKKKQKFDKKKSVPAGLHRTKAGKPANKKTSLDRDAVEVTFYEDRIKEIKALHDELSNIMEVIRPYMLSPEQTAPQQGLSASRPGHSAQAPQVLNKHDPVSP